MKEKITNNMVNFYTSLRLVFKIPQYRFLSLFIFIVIMLFAIWLPNLSFIAHAITSTSFSIGQKVSILMGSLGAIKTNFTPLSRTLTTVVAILFAIQISVITFYIKRRINLQKAAGISGIGIFSGILGVGCASCGSVILSAIFGVSATASFIGILPLKGQEFGILSIVIIGYTLFYITKKINDPLTCKIEI
ncbi:MAG: hypothetical protein ACYCZW_02755 [Minisyncoccota bacterium]